MAFRYPLGLWDPILAALNELGPIPSEYQSQKHASNSPYFIFYSIISLCNFSELSIKLNVNASDRTALKNMSYIKQERCIQDWLLQECQLLKHTD